MTKRRDVLKAMAATPLAAVFVWTPREFELAALQVENLTAPLQTPKFFTLQEWREISVLVDDLFPKDELGGSATDAKVPEYMDFILND